MHLDNFINELDKIRHLNQDFTFSLGKSIQTSDIKIIENKLTIVVPEKILSFLSIANGLQTTNPSFKLIDFDQWTIENGFIHFATFDNTAKIYFDRRERNEANQWSIINKADNYLITKTISSFWTNKIWHWLKQGHKIWVDNWEKDL